MFLIGFVYVSKNSNFRGTRRFFISLTTAWLLIFGGLESANA